MPLQWRVVARMGVSNQVAPFASGFGLKLAEQADMQPGYSSGGTANYTSYNGIPWSDSIENPAAGCTGTRHSNHSRSPG